jgi:diacylglycerol kinase family enzyme
MPSSFEMRMRTRFHYPLCADGMRVLLIYNPTAGDSGVDLDELLALLAVDGHAVDTRSVKDDGWEGAITPELELVAVAGGDGTVSKVFKHLAGTETPATVLPLGSANNIARSLGFDDPEPARLIRGWTAARRRSMDVGSVSFAGEKEAFVESVGGGLFAEVIERAKATDDDDKIELGLRLLNDVVRDARAVRWRVEADGADLSGAFLAAEAMNVRETGPNIPIAPNADPGDGQFELVLIRPEDRSAFASYVDARVVEAPQFEAHPARRLVFEPLQECPVHLDGDLVSEADAETFTVGVGSQVQVLVPRL